MRSPPASSSSPGFFLPSPTYPVENGAEEEVEALFNAAQKVTVLNSKLAAVIDNHKSTFLGVFGRLVQLVKSRSQAFEDAHVTVYDKVLLLLTNNGRELESAAAITWYCVEYLGVNTNDEAGQSAQALEQAIVIPHTLLQVMTPSLSRKHSDQSDLVSASAEIVRSIEPSDIKDDPVFSRLWSVYNKAQAEYLELSKKSDSAALEAAKFLRDTAENGVHFLKNKYPNDPMLAEMTATYDKAKANVLDLNGGRKRKFDSEAAGGRTQRRPFKALYTAEHNRASFALRKQREERGNPKPRGRGPSGIPFGYTRPVDSFRPA